MKKLLFRISLLFIATIIACFVQANAADRFYIDSSTILPGEVKTIPIYLENSQNFYGFQFDVSLADGLSIKTNDSDKPDFKLSERCASSYQLFTKKLENGIIRVGSFSATHTPISGNNGALLYVTLKASNSFIGGTITLKDVSFIDEKDNDVLFPNTSATINKTDETNSLLFPDFEIIQEEEKTLGLSLSNETTFTAFQTDIFLTGGLSIVDGSIALTSRESSSHELSVRKYSETHIRVVCMALDNTAINDNSGEILTFMVKAENNVTTGSISFSDNLFITPSGRELSLANVTASAQIKLNAVESVTINKTALSLKLGESEKLSASVFPDYVSDKSIVWTSSNSDIATVEQDGTVKANAIGQVDIKASSGMNPEKFAICKVTVNPIVASSVTLNVQDMTLLVGQTDKLTATVSPENTTDKTLTWKSDNEAVAKVDVDGAVTAVSVGVANITASSGDANATCKVKVFGLDDVTIKPGDGTTEGDEDDTPGDNTENGGSLIGSDLTLRVNQTSTIELEIPEGLSVEPRFEWTLDNGGEEIVEMTVIGNTLSASFKGLKVGESGYSVSFIGVNGNIEAVRGKITVIAETPIASLELDPTAITMAQNALPQTIKPIYTPDNATMPEFNWTSSVPTVATVSQDGIVTPVGQGETVITATALDGSGLSATSKVTVTEPVDENFEFDFDESVMGGKEGISLYIGETYTFTPKAQEGYVLPDVINWSSSDAETVSVDSNGKITALKLGKATITATASVNGKEVKAPCEVTVIPILATSISISGNDIHTLKQTETLQLTVTFNPGNTTNQEITWTSSDEGKATVSNSGLVTAVEEGSVEITATLVYQPEITTSYSITVQKRLLGDANDNGVVNIADVGTISDYIVEKPVYEFCFVNADVVTDNKITTADVTATLDIIFNDAPVMTKAAKAYRNVSQTTGNLIVEDFKPSVFGNSTVGISLAENSDLVGLQATMIIPEGMTVENVRKGNGASDHILNYYITDYGTLNFILYSLNNSTFETKNGPLVEITVTANEDCENIQMNNILASDAFANEYSLSFSGGENKGIITSVFDLNSSEIKITSAAESVIVTNAMGEVIRIFAPSGELIKSETATSDNETFVLTPGIYIVTVKEKTAKLIIK